MTHPEPVVTEDSGVPEVEQADFEKEVARRQARLEADRVANRPANLPVTPAEERTGGMTLRDMLDGLLSAAAEPDFDVDTSCRAEILRRFGERTGVSDVKWAVREQVAILRAYLDDVASRFLPSESSVIFETLDRIEQWTRGAQR